VPNRHARQRRLLPALAAQTQGYPKSGRLYKLRQAHLVGQKTSHERRGIHKESCVRIVIRYIFRAIHYTIGPALLLWEKLATPAGVRRPAEVQQQVDASTRSLVLYQFLMCPFCVSVRRTIKKLSLNIETRDALRDMASRSQLLQGGGQVQVPCLRITDAHGNVTWMYESRAIINYLQTAYADTAGSRRR
jgi:glutaredoxin